MSQCDFYLSRIVLEPEINMDITKMYMQNPDYTSHQIIRGLFNDKPEHLTFWREKPYQWLVRSSKTPELSKNYLNIITKPVSLHINNGDTFLFNLLCSPQMNFNNKKMDPIKIWKENSNNPPKTDDEILMEWLYMRQRKYGFEVARQGPNALSVSDNALIDLPKGGNKGKHRICLFNGLIKVIDSDIFSKTLLNGIGPYKFSGYGMINLRPV